ncbi:MAG: MFS transporter [Aeromicrobium sp.]
MSQVIGGIGNGAGIAVGSLIVKEVSGSSGWAGMATVMLTLGAALFTLPLAALASSRGRRPPLTIGWLLGACGAFTTIAGANAGSLPVTLFGLILFGASTAANLQSRFAAVDLAEPGQLGRSLSLVIWSTTVGAVIGPNLTGPGASLAGHLGVPDLAGPLVFSGVGFLLAGLLIFTALRPDPLIEAGGGDGSARTGIRAALPYIRGSTLAGILTVSSAHAVMVAVMAMTPVHMKDHGAALDIIGLTISLHIAGMYALSPVMGWLSDTWGARQTILLGQSILLLAVFIAGTSGQSNVQISAGLILLGLGWSASVIAGSALVSQSLTPDVRPSVQGLSDLAMNLSGASGGLLAGLIMAGWNFGTLNVAASALTIPVIFVIVAGRRTIATLPAAP